VTPEEEQVIYEHQYELQ